MTGLVCGDIHLEQVPHDDFSVVEDRFDAIVASRGLHLGECVVNVTGGNKLMALAVSRRGAA